MLLLDVPPSYHDIHSSSQDTRTYNNYTSYGNHIATEEKIPAAHASLPNYPSFEHAPSTRRLVMLLFTLVHLYSRVVSLYSRVVSLYSHVVSLHCHVVSLYSHVVSLYRQRKTKL